MVKAKILCLFLIFLVSGASQFLFGQGDSSGGAFYLESRLSHGFIIIHSQDVAAVKNSYPWGFEFDLGWISTSESAWHRCNCHTRLGASLGVWDFDSPQILGQAYAAQFFIEPAFGAQNDLSFSFRAGFGLSYQTRPYDEEENPDNQSYSTSFAFPLQVATALRWRFLDKWQAHAMARYNHISNGGFRQPNKGINWPTASIGVAYFPVAPHLQTYKRTDWRTDERSIKAFAVSAFGGYQELNNGIFLGVGGLETKYRKRVARISALSLGAEWMYHGKYPYDARRDGETTHGHMAGIAAGHEFLLGDFLFHQQFGFYLFKPPNELRDVYQRYGITYLISDQWGVGVALKAHAHVADFMDIRISYLF